jgi:hypothetical protein
MILSAIAAKLKRRSKDDFKGRHFEAGLIVQAVSWCLRYPLSYRDIEEMLLELGLEADHSTVNRWVLAYAPLIERRLRPFRKPHCGSIRVDETYVRIRGEWRYLYRAIDKHGEAVDFPALRNFAVEVAHPVEVRADQKAHLVQWLSRRLNQSVVVPDLSDQGFRSTGGRLLPTDTEPAALLMYDDDRGTRLTLYTRAGRSDEVRSSFGPAHEGDVLTLGWTESGHFHLVTARADTSRLLSVGEAIDGQIRAFGGGRI